MTWPQIAVTLAHKDLSCVPRRAELGAGVPGANTGGKILVVYAGPLGGVDIVNNVELRAVTPSPVGYLFCTRAPLGEHFPSKIILYLNWPVRHTQGLAPDMASPLVKWRAK